MRVPRFLSRGDCSAAMFQAIEKLEATVDINDTIVKGFVDFVSASERGLS